MENSIDSLCGWLWGHAAGLVFLLQTLSPQQGPNSNSPEVKELSKSTHDPGCSVRWIKQKGVDQLRFWQKLREFLLTEEFSFSKHLLGGS